MIPRVLKIRPMTPAPVRRGPAGRFARGSADLRRASGRAATPRVPPEPRADFRLRGLLLFERSLLMVPVFRGVMAPAGMRS